MLPNVGYAGIGAFLPRRVLTNDDLQKIVETSDEWIQRRTGIQTRRILDQGETLLDMAVTAARRALQDAGIDAEEVDDIRVGVNTWMRFPSLGTQIQKAIGARHAAASDISAGCAGFLYAVEAAFHRIVVEQARYGRATTALVVGVDALSHITDWTDRQTCVLLGDAAGAVVLRQMAEGGILATHTHADGRYGDMLWSDPVVGCQTNGGPLGFAHETRVDRPYLHMNGRKVFAVAVETMARDIHHVIDKYNRSSGAQLTLDDIDYLFPHQANLRILEKVARRLDVPMEKVYTDGVVSYGNTSTASIPVGYWDRRDRLDSDHARLEIDVAFGAGFASGAILRRVPARSR